MKVLKLVLHKSKRFAVRGITHFEADFNNPHQVIIGTNGSCKSYILSEASPLPPVPKMFYNGGYKEFHCTHRGSTYKLKSVIEGNSAIHSFIKDGEDLNENGTATIQKELVEKFFSGLTQDKFNTLIGKRNFKFTEMDANKRRKAIMDMSGIDLDLALEVYNALKAKTRDFTGHVKRLNQKLASESSIMIDNDEVKEMEQKLISLKSEFDEIIRLLDSNARPVNELEDIILNKMERLIEYGERLSHFLANLKNEYISPLVTDHKSLKDYIVFLDAEINATDREMTDLYQEAERIDGELNKLKEAGLDGINEYATIIQTFETELKAIDQELKRLDFDVDVDDFSEQRYNVFIKHVQPMLMHLLSNLKDNSNNYFNLQRTDFVKQRMHDTYIDLTKVKNTIVNLEHAIEHANNTGVVDCPKCNYNFKPGFVEDFDTKAPVALARHKEHLASLEKLLLEDTEYMSNLNDYSKALTEYENYIKRESHFADLWNELGEYGLETKYPLGCTHIIERYKNALEIAKIYFNVERSMLEKKAIFEQASKLDTKDIELNKTLSANIHEKIEKAVTRYTELKKQKSDLAVLDHKLMVVSEHLLKCEYLIDEFEKLAEEEESANCNVLIEDLLISLKQEIGMLENQISTVRVQKAIVDEIKSSVEHAKFEQALHKTITDELSPTDGLIADVMKDFINTLTDDINTVIDNVWTYPLVVLPCISSKEGLDYKFPIRVFGSDVPIPDVSEGSSAQLDIIDFAYMVMFKMYNDMEDFPLYLDETISRMDETHRPEMIRVIESMVENNQCSQMFFISQFAAQHESFSNSEVMITDTSNIVMLPTVFNKHVIMT